MVDNSELLNKFPDLFWAFLQPVIQSFEIKKKYQVQRSQFVEVLHEWTENQKDVHVDFATISEKVDKRLFNTDLLQNALTPKQSIRVELPRRLSKVTISAYHETDDILSPVIKLIITQTDGDMLELTNSTVEIQTKSDNYEKKRKHLIFYPGGCSQHYYAKGRHVKRPFLFQDVRYWTNNEASKSVMSALYAFLSQQETLYFWKDCVQELVDLQRNFAPEEPLLSFPWIAPVSFQDIFVCYSKKNWMETKIAKKYKPLLHMNWNHHSLFYGYLVYKTLPYLDEPSQQIIQNTKWDNEMEMFFCKEFRWEYLYANSETISSRINDFLAKWFWVQEQEKHTHQEWARLEGLLLDTMDMMQRDKHPISLRKSTRQLLAYHDRRSRELELEGMPELRISKRSKFHQLRKRLPKEWTWITSKERLFQEGREMHNCVAFYAEKINTGKCAIYSLEVNGTRYTAEFAMESQGGQTKFSLVQLESKYNQGHNVLDWKEIESCLQ